jgi:diguanylate cyclase (GGDEF)-like protein
VNSGKDRHTRGASIELTALAGDRVLEIHAQLLSRLRAAQQSLQAIRSAEALFEYLLGSLPRSLGAPVAELRLHDPDGALGRRLATSRYLGGALLLVEDSDALHSLYPNGPAPERLGLDDPRMFRILANAGRASGALIVPVSDGSYLSGSYHLALQDDMADYSGDDGELLGMLGELVAATLLRVIQREELERLALVDPLTELRNLRAFRSDLLREVHWARRVRQAFALLYLAIDDFEGLQADLGEGALARVQQGVAQSITSRLRTTDYLALIDRGRFAAILPACNEPQAHSIGERLCRDVAELAVDDGRGGSFQVSLSIGLISWEPVALPMRSSERLALQMQSEADAALARAVADGGDTVSVARLGLLML